MFAIELENVHKAYEDLIVLRGLSLQVRTGQVYGVLGPNGVGKSTLIHLLLGFLKPSYGSIRILGTSNLEKVRSRVGYLPERLRYHLRYTGREYLRYLGQFNDLSGSRLTTRVEEELHAVGLTKAADRMLSTYSKGMLQRLGIAQALLTDPEVLLIDEPTSGLDPAGQREMLDLLSEVRNRGHTIFMATHFLDEIEHLCDTVGILFDGRIAAEADVRSLRSSDRNVVVNVGDLSHDLAQQLQGISSAVRCNGREIMLQPNTQALQVKVLRMLLDAEVPIVSLEPQGRPLEELYLRVVRGGTTQPRPPIVNDISPPNGYFAPPGHPDALPTFENPDETSASNGRFVPPDTTNGAASPGRPGTGETLLRELLNRYKKRDNQSPNDRNGA